MKILVLKTTHESNKKVKTRIFVLSTMRNKKLPYIILVFDYSSNHFHCFKNE